MTSAEVIEFYSTLESVGIEIWIDGGWGVDALLGEQTRRHKDLDIAIQEKDVPQLRDFLAARGYKDIKVEQARDWNFVLGDEDGREVDVHVMEIDEHGDGIYGPRENGEKYPAASLSGTGLIAARTVRCISAEWMVKFHSGYELKEKDFRDVSALCAKFGIDLPPEYKRFQEQGSRPAASQSFLFAAAVIKSRSTGRCFIPGVGKLLVGTSGYSYKEWKGNFYPEKLPDKEMLSFYAKQFSTVEINHSFYRMPTESALQNWAKSVPQGFRFALKANQQITHIKRLRDCESTLKRFLEVASILNDGDHLGPILVQLPPTFKFDRPLLEDFLALRPPAFLFAFEVRHPSWYTEETYEVLRKLGTALCLSETDKQTPPDVITAPFTYARLRLEGYTPKQIKAWKQKFDGWLAQGVDVYVYFKHEDAGKAPAYARQLLGSAN